MDLENFREFGAQAVDLWKPAIGLVLVAFFGLTRVAALARRRAYGPGGGRR
jgi:hypothetical protein